MNDKLGNREGVHQEPPVRARIREYYMGNPTAEMTRESFAKVLRDVNPHTINHHLKFLLDEGFVQRLAHGIYTLNPDWTNGQVVTHGQPPKGRFGSPPPPPLPQGQSERREVPDGFPFDIEYTGNTVAYLVSTYANSLLARMEAAGFPGADVEFVSRCIADRFPPRRRAIDS